MLVAVATDASTIGNLTFKPVTGVYKVESIRATFAPNVNI